MNALDHACPKCGALQGEACVDARMHDGQVMAGHHKERTGRLCCRTQFGQPHVDNCPRRGRG